MTVEQILQKHPLPWGIGEAHEWMCEVVDAKERVIFRVTVQGGLWQNPSDIAKVVIHSINAGHGVKEAA